MHDVPSEKKVRFGRSVRPPKNVTPQSASDPSWHSRTRVGILAHFNQAFPAIFAGRKLMSFYVIIEPFVYQESTSDQ
jgi:hypothetical protein